MSVTFLLHLVLVLATTASAYAWLVVARRQRFYPANVVALIVGSVLLVGSAQVIALSAADGTASAAGMLTVATIMRLAGWFAGTLGAIAAIRQAVLTGRLALVVAESLVVGVCSVGLVWGVSVWRPEPSSLVIPVVSAVVAAAMVSVVVHGQRASGVLVVDTRSTTALLLGAMGGVVLCAGVLADVTAGPSAVVASLLVVAGLSLIGLAGWAGPLVVRFDIPLAVQGYGPTALAAATLVAIAAKSFSGGVDSAAVSLLVLVGLGLVAAFAVVQHESSRLVSELEYSRTRLSALADNAADVIIGLDAAGRMVAVNAAAQGLLHRGDSELIGRDISVLADPECRAGIYATVHEVVTGLRVGARVEVDLAEPATGTAELRLRGVPGGAVAVLSDVTDAVELRQRLERMARFDAMTGLVNRAHVLEELNDWLHNKAMVSLLYVDLDSFKAINDRFGHHAGDEVLIESARRLTETAQVTPAVARLVGRLGGDEFVVMLRDVSPVQARDCAEKIVAALGADVLIGAHSVRVSASVGVANSTDLHAAGANAADLLHRADMAMFAAKDAGRANVISWTLRLAEQARRRVEIAHGLRQALDEGNLSLAFQPIVRLSDGVIVAVEALIRMRMAADVAPGIIDLTEAAVSQRSATTTVSVAPMVNPAELVEVAEDMGEIDELGQWVLSEATHQAALWQTMGVRVPVNVNMSVRQLSDVRCVESVRTALADAKLDPQYLVIEVTESQMLDEGSGAWHHLRALQDLGVGLAIDDFGSGYSSLSYLRRLPVQTVKVDKTLVDGVGSDSRATTVIRAVIGAARGMGMNVVCEGIEDMSSARLLRDYGVWAGQGFALYGALPAAALLDALEAPPLAVGAPAPTG